MQSNTSKYRYDRVTMGILMSDFAFSKGSAYFHEVFRQAGPQAARDMLLAAPPIAILGRIAALFRNVTPDRREFPAFLVLFGTISAIAGTVVAVLA